MRLVCLLVVASIVLLPASAVAEPYHGVYVSTDLGAVCAQAAPPSPRVGLDGCAFDVTDITTVTASLQAATGADEGFSWTLLGAGCDGASGVGVGTQSFAVGGCDTFVVFPDPGAPIGTIQISTN
jgi:hypothetical protein